MNKKAQIYNVWSYHISQLCYEYFGIVFGKLAQKLGKRELKYGGMDF